MPTTSSPTIYARARAELERRGWRQGPSDDPHDFEAVPDHEAPCCTLLALYDAGTAREADAARERMLEVLGVGAIGLWNDAPGRTVEQVFALLDQLDTEGDPW